MMQKKARNRRPGQQIELKIDGVRIVASLWMYRGTWVAETTMKGGRYYQAVGTSDLAVMQRLEAAIRTREARIRAAEQSRSQGGQRPGPPGPPGPPAQGFSDQRGAPGPAGGVIRPPRPRGQRPEGGPVRLGPRPPGDGPPRGRPASQPPRDASPPGAAAGPGPAGDPPRPDPQPGLEPEA